MDRTAVSRIVRGSTILCAAVALSACSSSSAASPSAAPSTATTTVTPTATGTMPTPSPTGSTWPGAAAYTGTDDMKSGNTAIPAAPITVGSWWGDDPSAVTVSCTDATPDGNIVMTVTAPDGNNAVFTTDTVKHPYTTVVVTSTDGRSEESPASSLGYFDDTFFIQNPIATSLRPFGFSGLYTCGKDTVVKWSQNSHTTHVNAAAPTSATTS